MVPIHDREIEGTDIRRIERTQDVLAGAFCQHCLGGVVGGRVPEILFERVARDDDAVGQQAELAEKRNGVSLRVNDAAMRDVGIDRDDDRIRMVLDHQRRIEAE